MTIALLGCGVVGGGVLEAVLMLTSAVGTARKPERRGEDYGK